MRYIYLSGLAKAIRQADGADIILNYRKTFCEGLGINFYIKSYRYRTKAMITDFMQTSRARRNMPRIPKY